MEQAAEAGEQVVAYLNPMTLSVGKMLGGLLIIGLLLYMFGVDYIIDLLMFIAFPAFIVIAGVAMVSGGGLELWSASAMKAGLAEGIKQARQENAAREPEKTTEYVA